MGASHFKELVCWQLANQLKKEILAFTAKPPARYDRDFCDDIRSSARSAPSNISEGFGRYSHREFAHFLSIARGSLMESENHLQDALDSNYLTPTEHARLTALAVDALKATTKFHSYLSRTPHHRTKHSQKNV
jgi:four helix bundle protein